MWMRSSMCSNLLVSILSMNDKANSILETLLSSVNVGFREDVWTWQTSCCNNICCTVFNETPIAFTVEWYVLWWRRGISFKLCRNSTWDYLSTFVQELFREAISGVIIRDSSHAPRTCPHNLLMVLRATPISSVTMVSEPHGNTPSFNWLNNKPNAFSAAPTTSPHSWEPYRSNDVQNSNNCPPERHQLVKTKWVVDVLQLQLRLWHPRLLLRTYKIYIKMYLLSYTNQQYRFG